MGSILGRWSTLAAARVVVLGGLPASHPTRVASRIPATRVSSKPTEL
jgi:hypothetical protein